MIISYSKSFEKKFSKYDRKLQEKIFQAIQNIPEGDIKRLTGDDIPPPRLPTPTSGWPWMRFQKSPA